MEGQILLQKTLLEVLFFVICKFFPSKIMFFLSENTTDNIISSLETIEKLFFPETCFFVRQLS